MIIGRLSYMALEVTILVLLHGQAKIDPKTMLNI